MRCNQQILRRATYLKVPKQFRPLARGLPPRLQNPLEGFRLKCGTDSARSTETENYYDRTWKNRKSALQGNAE